MNEELKTKITEVIELADEQGNDAVVSMQYAILGACCAKQEILLAGHIVRFIEEVLLPKNEENIIQQQARRN